MSETKIQYTTTYIRDIMHDIRKSVNFSTASDKRKFFLDKYNDFALQLPKLFEGALNDMFPLNYLDFMLEQLELLKTNQQDIDKTDEVVIGKLRTHYVDPVLEKLSLNETKN